MEQHENYSLSALNTFGIAATARRYATFATPQELQAALAWAHELAGAPILLVGQGSNLLFTRPFAGTVLHSCIMGIDAVEQAEDHVLVRAGSGVVWDELVAHCVEQGWYGLENLSLIPGLVGASAVQNIGAYGSEAKDFIEKVETVDLRTGLPRTFGNAECRYAYRSSIFKHQLAGRYAITHVTYRLSRQFHPVLGYGTIGRLLEQMGGHPTAARLRQAIIDTRRAKLPDPAQLGNAGSFFMNPVVPAAQFAALQSHHPDMPHYDAGGGEVKIPAAWLIEQAGWKGRNLGPAGVYERQALVLVNRGGATAADVLALCSAIQADVKRMFDIELRPEVIFI